MAANDRRLSGEWGDLQDAGQVPNRGKGTTAKQAERDRGRKRRRMPTEDRRRGRKISPTLSSKLIHRLRAICRTEGYVGQDGEGLVASPVIEDLLWAAVEAYERGELEPQEEIVMVRQRLRRTAPK